MNGEERTYAERVEIRFSLKKIPLLFLGSVGFVALGLWIVWSAVRPGGWATPFDAIAGLACIAFFGLTGVYSAWKFFDRRPAIVLDREGIHDRSNPGSPGLVRWTDIVGFEVQTEFGSSFITVLLRNPDEYLTRGGRFRRKIAELNGRMFQSPVQLATKSLDIGFDELLQLLKRMHATYGK